MICTGDMVLILRQRISYLLPVPHRGNLIPLILYCGVVGGSMVGHHNYVTQAEQNPRCKGFFMLLESSFFSPIPTLVFLRVFCSSCLYLHLPFAFIS
ncbi:hypothetical protein HOY80DRAFT_759811 [Tuber brumale]|nr:hypothetical protein HOY80DRAFT_759811 [Tuber brumale]